jgi:hypothetical protein
VTRYVVVVAVLTFLYALALASFHPWDLAIGAVLAAALLFAVRRTARQTGDSVARPSSSEPMASRPNLLGRVRAFFPFAVAVGRGALTGAWRVFLATVGLRRPLSPASWPSRLGRGAQKGAGEKHALMMLEMSEVTPFPPLARFFIGLLLILIIEGSAVLFALYLHSKY